jgi:hypothetical protein
MRLNEFADAQAQLDLLRIIIDNTWSAIAQQAEEQKRVEAERKAQAKLEPKSKKTSKASITRTPTTASIKIKKTDDRLMKQQPPAVLKPDPNASNAVKPLPLSSNLPRSRAATSKGINPKFASTALPKPLATTPIKPQTGVNTDINSNDIEFSDKDDDGVDTNTENLIDIQNK